LVLPAPGRLLTSTWASSRIAYVLFSVLVLSSVGIFVVLSWSQVSVSWLSVGVLMNINNFVVVWVMRISSWVGVDSLVVVMDCFVIDVSMKTILWCSSLWWKVR